MLGNADGFLDEADRLMELGFEQTIRLLLAQTQGQKRSKIIVFLSCTDSMDFHWSLLGNSSMDGEKGRTDDENDKMNKSTEEKKNAAYSPLLPGASISATSSILICTSVASRGLDLPLVRTVIQYDLPTEGGTTEYVDRVGQTALAGKDSEAWSIVAPSESEWVKGVKGKMRGDTTGENPDRDKINITLEGASIEGVLAKDFDGKGTEYEERATERKENRIFHVRHLHIGHLAKPFALREAPKTVTDGKSNASKGRSSRPAKLIKLHDVNDAEQRGRLSKKGGNMISSRTDEQPANNVRINGSSGGWKMNKSHLLMVSHVKKGKGICMR
ncbi:hypothetical protein DFH29DRAFT_992229 [Suillus ampliporus]|nr:hypothetical protein DFH29DRAFT_992229 [Suillus ampliporus]